MSLADQIFGSLGIWYIWSRCDIYTHNKWINKLELETLNLKLYIYIYKETERNKTVQIEKKCGLTFT